MSVATLQCSKCHHDCRYESLRQFPPNQQATYAVSWLCPQCGYRAVDVCNLGPLVPQPDSCLNCGELHHQEQDQCPGCGLTRPEAMTFLHLASTPRQDIVSAAQEAFQRGWFQHGMALANQSLQHDFGNTGAWQVKTSFLRALSFHEANEQMLAEAIKLGAPPFLLLLYGSALQLRGTHAEAVDAFRKYLESEAADTKDLAMACSEQGKSLSALGKFKAAEEAHKRAIASMPTWAVLYLNYSDMFIEQGRWKEALSILEQGLGHVVEREEKIALLDAKVHVLGAQLRGDEALACADEALALGGNSVSLHYNRGRALAMIGRLEEARHEMTTALQMDPNSACSQRALEQINAALRG